MLSEQRRHVQHGGVAVRDNPPGTSFVPKLRSTRARNREPEIGTGKDFHIDSSPVNFIQTAIGPPGQNSEDEADAAALARFNGSNAMSLGLILLIVIVIALAGGFGGGFGRGYGYGYGHGGMGILGTVLVIVLILFLLGRI